MPVLKAPPKQPKTTVVQLRLDEETRTKLTKYAEFLDCSPSYVAAEALKLVCNKDKEFQSWLAGQPTDIAEQTTKGESFHLDPK
jgi:hypothetical protein